MSKNHRTQVLWRLIWGTIIMAWNVFRSITYKTLFQAFLQPNKQKNHKYLKNNIAYFQKRLWVLIMMLTTVPQIQVTPLQYLTHLTKLSSIAALFTINWICKYYESKFCLRIMKLNCKQQIFCPIRQRILKNNANLNFPGVAQNKI